MQKENRRSLARLLFSAAVCGVAMTLTGHARAQQVVPVQDDKSVPAGVSVPDSPGATEKLDKAREKEFQKQWKIAAEFYQDAIAKYPGRVVSVKRDLENGIYQYGGIAAVAGDRIAKWPAEGLTVYRAAFGHTAADLLASAPHGDTAALENIFWTYFPTDAGKTAGMRLLDANLERGDFQAAMWIGNRLLNVHPALGTDRGGIVFRSAIACQRGGDLKQARALLDDLKAKSPTELGSIGGKDVLLVDSLTAVLAAPPLMPTTRPDDADTYPSFGGLGGHGSISTSSARPGASLNSILLTKPEFAGLVNQQGQSFKDTDRQTINNNLAMGIMPVVDAGTLFFQDGRCIYAVDADTGAALPGWLNTYGGERLGRYKMNVPGRVSREPTTLSVTPTAVLAIMGQPDRNSLLANNIAFMMQGQPAGPPSTVRLVCLDRDTGKELWTKSTTDLPEGAAAVRNGSFSGTPLVIPANLTPYGEDCVMAIARGGNQFDDCYAICFSIKTGQFKWSTYLGSATRNYDTESGDPSQASLANGRVFIMTNLGTIAAMDPADGRILWLNSYAREGIINPEQMFLNNRRFNGGIQQQASSSTGSWGQNPVFVSDGCVFAMPRDAKQLFIYDAGDGTEKNRLPMSAFDDAEVLLGVRDGYVCLTTKKQLLVVDWRKYQDGDQKIATKWHEDLDAGLENSEVTGRGFMTADSIYIPTKYRLREIGWKSRRILQDYPSNGRFTGGEGPGNILVTARDVVVAGQTRVDVYTDLSLVRQRFEAAIAASPNDPAPRMGYAEALFAGGDMDGALQRVDQAIDLIGGIGNMRSGRERQEIFARLLDFAGRANKNKGKEAGSDVLAWEGKFYDRAAAAANSPLDNALYRRSRAQFDDSHADYTGEISLYQEILSDAPMRNAMINDDQSAGAAAEAAIDVVLKLKPSAYAAVEEHAVDALRTAREANDPVQLLEVATVYPNSNASVDARQDAVHRFEAANQPDKAIAVLRRMYAGTTEGGKRADILVSIANDFLTMPDGLGPALDRLCRAARIAPSTTLTQKLRLPDGTMLSGVTFAEAVVKLRQMQADQQNASLPDFHLAVQAAQLDTPFAPGMLKIPNVAALVHPLRDFNRPDQILTWGGGGLSIYSAGQTAPLASVPQVDKTPLAAAWTHDHWLVWTAGDVYQIDGDGRLAWDFPVAHLPTLLVSAGSDATMVNEVGDGTPDDNVAGVNQQVIINGQIRIVGGANVQGRVFRNMGNVVVQPVVPPPPVAIHAGDETIAAVEPGGDRVLVSTSTGRVMALDFRSGQVVWQTRPLDHAVDELLVNPHFTVARLDDPGGSQIAVYDTPTGHTIGRRRYGGDNTPTQLVNVALSEEATLAITEFSQVFVKDLYQPWKEPAMQLVAQNNRDVAPYVGLTQSDQLLVQGGRLACLYDGGQYARGFDLSRSGDPTMPLKTESNNSVVAMRMVGPRLYIQTTKLMREYSLADPSESYKGDLGMQDFIPKVHAVMLGKDYVIVVNDPVDRGPIGQPFVALTAYSRIPLQDTTREVGYPDWQVPRIRSSVGIMDFLGADGGVYFLAKDNTVYMKRGARP